MNTEGRARARSRSSGCSLPSAFNLSSHAFRWWPLSLSLSLSVMRVAVSPVQLHGGRRCRICGWPKADPSSVRPQIFDANETSSFEIRQRSLSARARASEVGRGLGGRGSRVARNCTFARPPPPMREGARGRVSAVSGEVSPATSTNLDFDLSPAGKKGERTGGSETDDCRTVAPRLQHSVYGEGTHPQIIARLEMQMNCPSASVRPSVPGRPTRLLGNAC